MHIVAAVKAEIFSEHNQPQMELRQHFLNTILHRTSMVLTAQQKNKAKNKSVTIFIWLFLAVSLCFVFFFHHKMTENCNRFDDFTTLSHSAKRTIVKADRAGCLLLRGLKISDTHMRARRRSRTWGRGARAAYTVHF